MVAMAVGRTVACLQLVTAPPSHFRRRSLYLSSSPLCRETILGDLIQSQLRLKKKRYRIKGLFSNQVVARSFGPTIFEASKFKVLFLGIHGENHPAHLPRTYTLTHNDITSKIMLAILQTINKAQIEQKSEYHILSTTSST